MVITLTSTSQIVTLETTSGEVPARVWEGTTESGIPIHAFITRIAVHNDQDTSQFARELEEQRPPSALADQAWPSRMVL
jgi:hypothetical protein